jgi:hypothetical protein
MNGTIGLEVTKPVSVLNQLLSVDFKKLFSSLAKVSIDATRIFRLED